jgi:hypothetical protein
MATTLESFAHQLAIWELGTVAANNPQLMALQHLCEGKYEIKEIYLEGECLDCCIRAFDRSLKRMKKTYDLADEDDDENP